jgi:hypothetical protein
MGMNIFLAAACFVGMGVGVAVLVTSLRRKPDDQKAVGGWPDRPMRHTTLPPTR